MHHYLSGDERPCTLCVVFRMLCDGRLCYAMLCYFMLIYAMLMSFKCVINACVLQYSSSQWRLTSLLASSSLHAVKECTTEIMPSSGTGSNGVTYYYN